MRHLLYCKKATPPWCAEALRKGWVPAMVQRSGSLSMRGILHAASGRDKFSLTRFEPGPALRPFVEHYWVVRYDLPAGTSHTQTVLSFPNIHLAFEHDEGGRRALVYGIPRRPFVRELRGAGRTLGVTPKWVIKRFRLQEAAERIEQGAATSWTELAMQLGYFDQAHFIKDFKSVLGQTPAAYKSSRPS